MFGMPPAVNAIGYSPMVNAVNIFPLTGDQELPKCGDWSVIAFVCSLFRRCSPTDVVRLIVTVIIWIAINGMLIGWRMPHVVKKLLNVIPVRVKTNSPTPIIGITRCNSDLRVLPDLVKSCSAQSVFFKPTSASATTNQSPFKFVPHCNIRISTVADAVPKSAIVRTLAVKTRYGQAAKFPAKWIKAIWGCCISLTSTTGDSGSPKIGNSSEARITAIAETFPNNSALAVSFIGRLKKNQPSKTFIGKIDRLHLLGV